MKTVHALATEAAQGFEERARDDGKRFLCRKDDAPDWLAEVVQEAHGDFLPDDYRYRMIAAALDLIADGDEGDDLDDAGSYFADDAEVYNAGLLHWLASSVARAAYVDDAVDDYGYPGDLFTALQGGQARERAEVFALVVAALEAVAEDEDDDA